MQTLLEHTYDVLMQTSASWILMFMSAVVTSSLTLLPFVSALCTLQKKKAKPRQMCVSGRDLHWFALKTIQVYNCANTEKKYANENDIKV